MPLWTLGHHGKYFAPITVLLVSSINVDLSRLGGLGPSVNSCYPTMLKVFCLQLLPNLRCALDVLNNGLCLERPVRTHFVFYANVPVHNILFSLYYRSVAAHKHKLFNIFFNQILFPQGFVHYSTIYAQEYRHKAHNGNNTKITRCISNSFQFRIIKKILLKLIC